MISKGPVTLKTTDKADGEGKEITLGFTEQFRSKGLDEQKRLIDSYMLEIAEGLKQETDEREKQGLVIIQNIMMQLYPHIVSGDVDLDNELVIDVMPED